MWIASIIIPLFPTLLFVNVVIVIAIITECPFLFSWHKQKSWKETPMGRACPFPGRCVGKSYFHCPHPPFFFASLLMEGAPQYTILNHHTTLYLSSHIHILNHQKSFPALLAFNFCLFQRRNVPLPLIKSLVLILILLLLLLCLLPCLVLNQLAEMAK